MKHLLFTFIILVTLSFADASHSSLPYNEAYPILQKIDDQAIILGEGKQDIYVFIDPLCRNSRKFMQVVLSHEMMLKKYRYHLFMYEIKRLHSQSTIYAIYHQKKKLKHLISVMLEKKKLETKTPPDDKEIKLVNDIAQVAKELGVFKRPYLVISEKRE